MTLPLYRGAAEAIPPDRRRGHAGLHFERLFDGYHADWTIGETKAAWLRGFAGPVGDADALRRHALAQIRLVDSLGGRHAIFQAPGRFVTGTGYPHPVENGFAWHPVLGVPYLAGSSVKGLLRAWVEQWTYEDGDDKARRDHLLAWFGSDHKDPRERESAPTAGDLICFDAIPVAPVPLEVDIMTPHMGKWYEQGHTIHDPQREPGRVPADWHDPTPIPYLVAGRIALLFSVAPRNPTCAERSDTGEALDALQDALQWMGAGAKTAIGYGLMSANTDADARLRQALEEENRLRDLAGKSPEQRRIQALKDLVEKEQAASRLEPGGPVMQQLSALLTEALAWPDADREQLAGLAENAYKYLGWGNAKKKQQRKAAIERLRAGQQGS
jgi:CRISPR-associated protein Cmr6